MAKIMAAQYHRWHRSAKAAGGTWRHQWRNGG
jgi:hypothetical protein